MVIRAIVYTANGNIEKTFEKKLWLNKFISENIKDAYCIKLYAVHGIKERKRKLKEVEK